MQYPTNAELRDIDSKFAAEGVAVRERPDRAMWQWLSSEPDLSVDLAVSYHWFTQKFAALHPSVDFSPRPFAFLSVSARGISYTLSPPMVLGMGGIDPLRSVKISSDERSRIWMEDPRAFWELYYQSADGIDLFLSNLDFHPTNPEAADMLAVGTDQLEASARQLVAGAADAALSQACCLSAELVLKAILKERGATKAQLKAWGHRIPLLAAEVAAVLPTSNDAEFLAISNSMPNYVAVRYSPPKLSVIEAQHLYRRTLFVCAEALRRTRHDQLYYKMVADPSVPVRHW